MKINEETPPPAQEEEETTISEEESLPEDPLSDNLSQWFIRAFALVIAGLFMTVLLFTLSNLEGGLFYLGLGESPAFSMVLFSQQLGNFLWSFRVFDLLFVVAIMLQVLLLVIFLINHKKRKVATRAVRYQEGH